MDDVSVPRRAPPVNRAARPGAFQIGGKIAPSPRPRGRCTACPSSPRTGTESERIACPKSEMQAPTLLPLAQQDWLQNHKTGSLMPVLDQTANATPGQPRPTPATIWCQNQDDSGVIARSASQRRSNPLSCLRPVHLRAGQVLLRRQRSQHMRCSAPVTWAGWLARIKTAMLIAHRRSFGCPTA